MDKRWIRTPVNSLSGWAMTIALVVVFAWVAIPRLCVSGKLSSNETAAIATLRNLTACQERIQLEAQIDSDGDGVGEFGTFLELTGSVAVRKGYFPGSPGSPAGSDFSKTGPILALAFPSIALHGVDEKGVVRKAGYCFLLYLPGATQPAGFVHETGPAARPGLTGRIGVDAAEKAWCAYAWPVDRGDTGNRCFFVNQTGDVLQSPNTVARWSGGERPMAPESAFLGTGITGRVAAGTRGRDGDVWKVTN